MPLFAPFKGLFTQARLRKSPGQPIRAAESTFTFLKGDQLKAWVDRLPGSGWHKRSEDPDNPDIFPEEIAYESPNVHEAGHRAHVGEHGAAFEHERSFIYLDVGAWIGTKQESGWGMAGYQRDFGIVCGPHVLLCTFSSATAYGAHSAAPIPDQGWAEASTEKVAAKDVAIRSIKALLDEMAFGEPLGHVVVTRYLLAESDPTIPAEKDYVLRIVFGDMHLPVLDDPDQNIAGMGKLKMDWVPAYNEQVASKTKDVMAIFGAALTEQEMADAKRAVREGVHEVTDNKWVRLLSPILSVGTSQGTDAIEDALFRQFPLHIPEGDRVRRMGRLDLEPIRRVATIAFPKANDKEAAGFAPLVKALSDLGEHWHHDKAALLGDRDTLKDLLNKLLGDLGHWVKDQDLFGVLTDTMTEKAAREWCRFYREGDGGPPADIFGKAGGDFMTFCSAVEKYAQKAAQAKLLPHQFHQLGDMVDLWIGFTCHYRPAHAIDDDGTDTATGPLANYGRVEGDQAADDAKGSNLGAEMAQYWFENCLTVTHEGQKVRDGLKTLHQVAGENKPSLLAGNHDTVVASASFKTELDLATGQIVKGKYSGSRPSTFDHSGLYMEHGHQWDKYNADNSPILPFTRLLTGRNAPSGELITQIAFIRPQPARRAPSMAAGAASKLADDPDPPFGRAYSDRTKAVAYAAERLVSIGYRYCYAMGHTHSPLLTRVRLRPMTDDIATVDRIRATQKNRPTKISAFFPGKDKPTSKGDGAETNRVLVGWKNALGHYPEDWYSLQDPEWAKGSRRRGLWKWVGNDSDSTDRSGGQFDGVPPGQYVLRYYLGPSETEAFVSTDLFYLWGISFEPPLADDDLESVPDVEAPVVHVAHGKVVGDAPYMRIALPSDYDDDYDNLFLVLRPKSENPHSAMVVFEYANKLLLNDVLPPPAKRTTKGGRFPLPALLASVFAALTKDAEYWVCLVKGKWNEKTQPIAWASIKVSVSK